jgi:RimJ/RimL family protein N-acetyltransferase
MRPVPADALPQLRPWFAPERPGPLIFEHVLRTGHGRCRVDRWPRPQVVLAELPGNYALRGDPAALEDLDLHDVAGFVDAPPEWLPALRALDPAMGVWDRLVAVLPDGAVVPPPGDHIRLLTLADAPALAALGPDSAWIHETWGGPAGLIAAGVAHAGTVDGEPVSIAVPFYMGGAYEDIGVVTLPAHRRRGLSTASTAAVVRDIRARGRVPTWTTSPDNTASLAVAARLGFTHVRDDVLYAGAHADPRLSRVSAPRVPAGPAGTRPPPRRPGRAPRASRRCAAGGSSRWPR